MNAQINSLITNAFNLEVYDPSMTDVQQTPVYDTVTIAAAGSVSNTTAQWFINVGANSNKTYAQTNLGQPKRLSAPESFSVQAIRFRVAENIFYTDFLTILNNFALEFWIGQKPYQRAPIWMYSAGGGIWSGGAATTVAATTIQNYRSRRRPTALALARSRCCATKSARSSTTSARPRSATTASRCSTCSRATRVTSCSRPPCRNW